MKKPWKIDVPVLLIFFARSETFERVFEAVRQARPSTLLLWQDGPREGRPDDLEGIERCREITEKIDWDCTVHRMYNEKNIGCDPSIYYAYQWAFTLVDRCIFLEDDQLPGESYFQFCKELLDKYEDDTRISHICGYNYTEIAPDCEADYLFAYSGSGAWATWKRVSELWEPDYAFLENEKEQDFIKTRYGALGDVTVKNCIRHKATGKEFWESIIGSNCMLNNQLAIIPKYNLVSNIGLTKNSTHSNTTRKYLPKVTQKLFEMKTYTYAFPLKHPKHMLINESYVKQLRLILSVGHPIRRKWRKLVYLFKRVFYR